MKNDLQQLIDQFLKILHLYAVINRKPKDYGTGDLLYLTEVHTIKMIGENDEINMTGLAGIMGVTKGAISQTIRKLVSKNLIIKENGSNRKEFNLRLSEKGIIVLRGQETLQQELFAFAETLYSKANDHDKELVRRLFEAISNNMEERVKAL
ncbi:MAG TPA: MarR family transcriptional regulator [Bacteroidales bacterium]|nr:MarR family transcriptional regulator [Bacteroidales bacterium]